MNLILLEWQSDNIPNLSDIARGVEVDTGIATSGNLGLVTLSEYKSDIYVSGQRVFIFAATDINLRGRTTFGNNRNTLAPVKVVPQDKVPIITEEGEILMSPAGPRPNGGPGQLFLDTGSGIASISIGSGYYAAYDDIIGNNGVTIGSSATIVGFNTIKVKDSYYQSAPNSPNNSGIVQVIQDGLYQISYGANFTKIAGTANTAGLTVKSELFINGIALPGSATRDGSINQANVTFGMSANTIAVLKAGDQITLRALKEITTTPTIRTNNKEVWITVIKLR